MPYKQPQNSNAFMIRGNQFCQHMFSDQILRILKCSRLISSYFVQRKGDNPR